MQQVGSNRGSQLGRGREACREAQPGKWPHSHDFQVGLAWLFLQCIAGKEVNPLGWGEFILLYALKNTFLMEPNSLKGERFLPAQTGYGPFKSPGYILQQPRLTEDLAATCVPDEQLVQPSCAQEIRWHAGKNGDIHCFIWMLGQMVDTFSFS